MQTQDKVVELTQEQAEAIIQIQMTSDILNNVLVMGKDWESDRASDDYLELTSEELEAVCDGEYTILQLWARG